MKINIIYFYLFLFLGRSRCFAFLVFKDVASIAKEIESILNKK